MTSSVGSSSATGAAGAGSAAAGDGAGSNAAASGVTSSTTLSSVADLAAAAPQVYQAMMQGIAMAICNQMEDSEARRVAMEKENDAENGG